jgi:predicted nucleic acid-binding protein
MFVRDAIIRGGQVILEPPLPLQDGTRVQVRVEPGGTDPLLFLAENAVATGVADLAEQHDRYIYGTAEAPRWCVGPAVFVDTWALLALINRDDAWHSQAVELSRTLSVQATPLLTTEWVLTEFLGGAARPPLRALAVESVRKAYLSPRFEIMPASHDDWAHGFELYEHRPDKSWSLVDCLSILACQRRGIADLFGNGRCRPRSCFKGPAITLAIKGEIQ